MSNLLGYFSSYFVSFGLGIGFLIGGIIFAFLLIYAVMLIFKKSRRAIQEDRARTFTTSRSRLVPVRSPQRRSNSTNNI